MGVQPDREHHLANHVRIQSIQVSLTVLASDSDHGQYVSDVIDLGALRTTIAIADQYNLDGVRRQLVDAFDASIRLAQSSVELFDQRSERFAAEMNDLTARMTAAREASQLPKVAPE